VLQGAFKYRVDIGPLLIVLATTSAALLPFLFDLPLWLIVPLWLGVFYGRTFIPFIQHNHGHLPTFNFKALNWLFDIGLAQNTGYPTALWELQHNRGHHRHFLTPDDDVAAITYRGTKTVMPRWVYAMRGNVRIHRDAIRIGLAEGRAGRPTLLPKLAFETLCQIVLTVALLRWNTPLAIAFFVIPNFLSAFFIWWQSYPHHLEMPMTNAYDGSMTVENATYNRVTFNIGHHTAHHEKPTLHWSLLPARTAQIRERIHPACFRDGTETVGNDILKDIKLTFSRMSSKTESSSGSAAE
jgi:beta-carotene hydroxylase